MRLSSWHKLKSSLTSGTTSPSLRDRRAGVYREDVQFAEPEKSKRVPYSITPEVVDRIRELRTAGQSELAISCELDMTLETVRRICRKHSIEKGSTDVS